ncbi:chitin synthase-like [Ceratina calcarata]|uniref:Chitin synthase-like n=1 Tax=Ceratina calcarata TaxID=156304 RepID=A0AAJ7S1M3_9HYME|nr:chitin synthase-like [Ceratina calcarata]
MCQVIFAAMISTVYGLVMVAVIVAIAINIAHDGLLSPIAIFLMMIVGEFVIAALLHPSEIQCLMHCLMYYITVPSMYLLLMIYSICNLDNITWGTREVQIKKTQAVTICTTD